DLMKLEISREGSWDVNPSHAVCRDTDKVKAEFKCVDDGDSVSVLTAAMTLRISRNPFRIESWRTDGSLIFRTAIDAEGRSLAYSRLNDQFCTERECQHEDSFFGLGEKTGPLNRKGRNYTLWNTDVLCGSSTKEFTSRYPEEHPRAHGDSTDFDPYYISIPFFYHGTTRHSGLAGFYFDNSYRSAFEFVAKDRYRVHFSGGQYTEYIMAGPSMARILSAYTDLTGRMQPPPMWALGHHQCRWHAYTQESTLELAKTYREKKIPCDTLWLDIDYMDEYRVFTWNKETFPRPQEMLSTLQDQGFRTITIIDPGVKYDPGYSVFDEALEQDLFCRTPGGSVYLGQVWPGRTAFPDFSLEETRQWWGNLNAEHVKFGLAGIWNDMNEPATGQVPARDMGFGRGRYRHERYHNEYALLMAMGTTQGLLSAMPEKRTFILSRAGSAGIQRYAANWMGDNFSRWDHLQMSVPMALGMGISGQPFVGADVGGFAGDCSMELLLRWYQCAAFTPFFRNHNSNGRPDQYPWSFGEAAERLCRDTISTRYRLMPYIYTQFMLSSESGDPIQRPLLYQYQEDFSARQVEDQFLFGKDLLVAPVFAPGVTSRNVYLPEGTWYDWRDQKSFSGGQWVIASAPLDSIPVFVRGGAVLPLWPEVPESTMNYHPETIDLHLFVPKEDGETASVLHEDDGSTFGFREGSFYRTRFSVVRKKEQLRLAVSVEGGGFSEFVRKRFRLIVHGPELIDVAVDGVFVAPDPEGILLEKSAESFVLSGRIPQAL
ncbi:MAG: TIM-barrel domain-containing protein, partial [Puniceicoccales bacterium]